MNQGNNEMRRQRLQEENEFLKMKMMLERGAMFGQSDQVPLPPELENAFLKRVMRLEQLFENPTYVKVFDKIGRPAHFREPDLIPAPEMAKAWEELYEYLAGHSIEVQSAHPETDPAELYRFVWNELFTMDIEALDFPGLVHVFTYHP